MNYLFFFFSRTKTVEHLFLSQPSVLAIPRTISSFKSRFLGITIGRGDPSFVMI